MTKRLRIWIPILALLCGSSAGAVPILQIYIDGATYDANTETWVITDPEFDLWVVGNVESKGTISDVVLTASFFGLAGTMTMTPISTTTITDPSVPPAPVLAGSGTGSHPVLPDHGIFNDVTLNHWEDFALGDFSLLDSPIADFNGSSSFPTSFPNSGQVNVYHVVVDGWVKVHFDASGFTTNTTNGKRNFWKSPFSHDGTVPVEEATWGAIKGLYVGR